VSDHREWRRQLEDLSDAFDVVAWDAPGTGGSSDPPESFRFDDYADCLAGFIEGLEFGRPHVSGLSWGSTLALALYGRRPDLPGSLILAGAYAGWAGSLPPEEVEHRVDVAEQAMHVPAHEYARSWLPTLLSDRAPPEMVAELLTIVREFRPSGVHPMLLAMAEADLRSVLPTIRVPTLLLYGEEDVRSPRGVAEEMRRAIHGSKLVFLPDAGHMANVEAADRFNDEVRRFLNSIA
jgi:pimeloyl-ACP methyl ester carboxylesterase